MLQGFPAETGVPSVKKEPPKLEGFYSEKAQALDELLTLDKTLAAKQAQRAISGFGSELAVGGLRTSQLAPLGLGPLGIDALRRWATFAAPVLTVLAAIALALVASWRAVPTTPPIQPASASADVVVPKAEGADIMLPAQTATYQTPVPAELRVPEPVGVPLRANPVPVSAIAARDQSQLRRVSSVGDPNVSRVQPVATSLQARVAAPVSEPAPVQLTQSANLPVPSTQPGSVLRPIDPPAERPEAALAVVEQRPADPTPAIRDVLRRYEAAYERLDASAAKEIWPSLDERALARAFSGLASQTLSLEPCKINVTGTSAVASCHGRATYVGRVGNKTGQVQRRDWTFELRKSTDDWQIRSVRFN